MVSADERLEQGHIERIFGAAHDFPDAAPVRWSYVILATPRTGSNMLCSALGETRLAGSPIEYLNPASLNVYAKRRGHASLDAYLREIMGRRTSPNGLFGLKLMPDQLTGLFGANSEGGARFLRGFTRFIRTFRRDKVGQAISSVLAHERKLWVTTDARDRAPERIFQDDDVTKISGSLSYIVSRDQYWKDAIARLKLGPVIDVAYEDLVADTPGEVARVLTHLGIDLGRSEIPAPKTIKLAGEGSREIRRRYLEAIGLGTSPVAE